MKKTSNKARIKKAQLDVICDFIETLNNKINQVNERREELQEHLNDNRDSVCDWVIEWLENGGCDDELTAYENLLKDIEKLI